MIEYEVGENEKENDGKKKTGDELKNLKINAEASQKYCIIRHRGNLS